MQPRRLSGRGKLDDQEQQREDDPGQHEQARGGPRQQRRHLDAGDPRAGIEGGHQQAETDTRCDIDQLGQAGPQRPIRREIRCSGQSLRARGRFGLALAGSRRCLTPATCEAPTCPDCHVYNQATP
jgi:hypothetical protein